jgi:hypothetical protein
VLNRPISITRDRKDSFGCFNYSTSQNEASTSIRNINEFNILYGHLNGYEIMYFGINLILMLDYRLSFDIEVKNSDKEIEVLMIKRKDDTKWKNNKRYSSECSK